MVGGVVDGDYNRGLGCWRDCRLDPEREGGVDRTISDRTIGGSGLT